MTAERRHTVANKLLTVAEVLAHIRRSLVSAFAEVGALSMFIEGQYNWERPEFDEHG